MAIIRTTIRIRTQRRFLPDDVVLLFACVTLIAATGILYIGIPTMYLVDELNSHASIAKSNAVLPPHLFDRIRRYEPLASAFTALLLTTIYLVKFCFLLFFLQLVRRLDRLFLAWKIAFGITALFYCFSMCSNFLLSCVYFGTNFGKPPWVQSNPKSPPTNRASSLQSLNKHLDSRKMSARIQIYPAPCL